MKIAIGSDHAAFKLKQILLDHLRARGLDVIDFGTHDENRTDYPIYAEKVARAVAAGEYERGILVCGSGVGMAISANKIKGIRAVVCSETYSAILSRNHNDSNVLCVGERVVGPGLAVMIADEWLEAEYEGGRHQRRVDMIRALDEQQPDDEHPFVTCG